jgi:hypothetical protein
MYRIAAMMLTLALALPAVAAPPNVGDKGGAEARARARAIAPFVDAQTVIVHRIDLSRIDAEALLSWAVEAGRMKKAEIENPLRDVRSWLTDFTKAGGKDLYVIIGSTYLPTEQPLLVLPLAADADADAVRRVLNRVRGFEQLHFEKFEQTLIGGGETARKRARHIKPSARPEVAEAFAAAGDTTAQLLLLPTPDVRRVLDELLPVLPPEAGGGSIRPLTHGLLWAAVGVDLPPKLSARLTIQSPDAAAARALKDFLARLLKSVTGLPEVRGFLPGIGRFAEVFTPQVEEDRLTLSGRDEELMALLQSVVRTIYQAAGRRNAENTLHRLGIAMHNYADTFKGRRAARLPALANFDKQGKPLLSWRVHLLPFLGEQKLYKEFHLDEPWDSPHNKKLLARMPDVYHGPNPKLNAEGKTIFVLPVGKEAAFKEGPEGPRMPADFLDGTSNTILIVEADDAHAVPWTKPEDLKIDPEHPQRGLGGHFRGGFLAALADGSVRLVAEGISKTTLQRAFNPADGKPMGPDW